MSPFFFRNLLRELRVLHPHRGGFGFLRFGLWRFLVGALKKIGLVEAGIFLVFFGAFIAKSVFDVLPLGRDDGGEPVFIGKAQPALGCV